jgi:PiT family inorganic phosphate transporter
VPTSSSHALVGGIAGAAVAKGGFDVLVASGLRTIGVFIVLSPLLGLALGLLLTVGVMWAVHRYRNVDRLNRGFRVGQLFSAAAFSLGHGGNDAQKTMGVILAVLIASNHLPAGSDVPLWVVLSAHVAIALGTLTGGWRIVKTMGSKITKLQPAGGMAAESAAAATCCSSRRTPAFQCRPRTPSPEESSASERVAGCPQCAGESPVGWYGHGSSRSRAPG